MRRSRTPPSLSPLRFILSPPPSLSRFGVHGGDLQDPRRDKDSSLHAHLHPFVLLNPCACNPPRPRLEPNNVGPVFFFFFRLLKTQLCESALNPPIMAIYICRNVFLMYIHTNRTVTKRGSISWPPNSTLCTKKTCTPKKSYTTALFLMPVALFLPCD